MAKRVLLLLVEDEDMEMCEQTADMALVECMRIVRKKYGTSEVHGRAFESVGELTTFMLPAPKVEECESDEVSYNEFRRQTSTRISKFTKSLQILTATTALALLVQAVTIWWR